MDHSTINWAKELRKAPEKIREAILSVEGFNAFEKIAKESGLHIDKLGILAKEIDMVMLGITSATEFKQRIETSLQIDSEKAEIIAKSVNDQMFSKIRDSLKQSTTEKNKEEVVEGKLNREDILREIEGIDRPKPETTLQANAREIAEIPEEKDHTKAFLEENVEVQTEPQSQKQEAGNVPHTPEVSFKPSQEAFEDKLSTSVSIETEKKESVEEEEDGTYKGRVDPYRETPE